MTDLVFGNVIFSGENFCVQSCTGRWGWKVTGHVCENSNDGRKKIWM